MTTCPKCNAAIVAGARFCASCGAMMAITQPGAEDELVGQVIRDRFRILSVLGEGGMGKVYLAEQKMGTATRNVAIKVLQPELASDPQIVARFHRETETVIGLSHPNTIAFYDFGEFQDRLFIAMEFIEGDSLATVLGRGPLDAKRCERILLQVCGSLHEAHEVGIVHRDLKPDNVILTARAGQKDFVKVLDFGIAKRSEAEDKEQAKLTKQGMVLGTPPYMSPEQFTGQELDRRSDVYSLGVMTYEMLTGHLPFEANTPWEWATKHLTAQPTPIERYDLHHRIDPRHRAAIEKSLHKDREKRQRTALEFAQEFAGIEDATGTWAMVAAGAPAGTGAVARVGAGRIPPTQLTPAAMPAVPSTAAPTPGPQRSMAPTPQAMPAAKSGGGGKAVAIILVLFLLLGGGAVGAYMVFSGPEPIAAVGTVVPSTGLAGTLLPQTALPQTVIPSTGLPVTGLPATGDPATGEPATADPSTAEPTPDAGTAADAGSSKRTPTKRTPTKRDPDPDPEPTNTGPSQADIDRARDLAREGMGYVRSNLDGAIEALRAAQRLVGRDHSVVGALKRAITQRGAQRAQSLIQQGNCPDAQALYRKLRTVGAASAAQQFFGPHCRAR